MLSLCLEILLFHTHSVNSSSLKPTESINSSAKVYPHFTAHSGGSDGRESAGNAEDPRSEDRLGNGIAIHLSVLAGESHGQRNLVGYSPWGHKEPDTPERPAFSLSLTPRQTRSPALLCYY